MKTLKKGLLLLISALFVASGAYAQKSIAKKADDLFDQYRFYDASKEYEKAYEKIKDNKAEKNRVYFRLLLRSPYLPCLQFPFPWQLIMNRSQANPDNLLLQP